MKAFLKVLAIAFSVGLILTIIQLLINLTLGKSVTLNKEVLIIFGYFQLYSIPLSIVNSYFFQYALKFSKLQSKWRLFFNALGSLPLTFLTLILIHLFIHVVINGESVSTFTLVQNRIHYIIGVFITLFIVMVHYSYHLNRELQQIQVKKQKVIAGSATARFDALKNQLDPHFLFNSLNVLTSLIEENPKNAQQFTTGLSKVYRYVLEQKNKDLVTVNNELDFARTYLTLLKMRFEDSLTFSIPEQSINPEHKIVPLSLQLLLENAVKHNVVSEQKPLHITIKENKDSLIVFNNLQPKAILKTNSGIGLNNIMQRYRIVTNRAVDIQKTDTEFCVKLPVLTDESLTITDETNVLNKRYLNAKKRVNDLKDFYYNALIYTIAIPILIFINYNIYWNYKWFWFPALGWGIGLLIYAYNTFSKKGISGTN